MLSNTAFIVFYSDLTKWKGMLRWQDTQGNAIPFIIADGVPFFIIGTRTLECQNGPLRMKKASKNVNVIFFSLSA